MTADEIHLDVHTSKHTLNKVEFNDHRRRLDVPFLFALLSVPAWRTAGSR